MEQVKDLITLIARSMVDHPEQVSVELIEDEHMSILELRVAKEDLGKIIGKHGKTANALRDILIAASGKAGRRLVLNIIE